VSQTKYYCFPKVKEFAPQHFELATSLREADGHFIPVHKTAIVFEIRTERIE